MNKDKEAREHSVYICLQRIVEARLWCMLEDACLSSCWNSYSLTFLPPLYKFDLHLKNQLFLSSSLKTFGVLLLQDHSPHQFFSSRTLTIDLLSLMFSPRSFLKLSLILPFSLVQVFSSEWSFWRKLSPLQNTTSSLERVYHTLMPSIYCVHVFFCMYHSSLVTFSITFPTWLGSL